jgi:hypothetical protein
VLPVSISRGAREGVFTPSEEPLDMLLPPPGPSGRSGGVSDVRDGSRAASLGVI